MSDALNYLVKVRPDAIGPYLAFLKEAGRHLDPKTRNLISVITKVHAQTERGFRQYLGRALRNGCTPAEVLDALLMAFPPWGWQRSSGRWTSSSTWTSPVSSQKHSPSPPSGTT